MYKNDEKVLREETSSNKNAEKKSYSFVQWNIGNMNLLAALKTNL